MINALNIIPCKTDSCPTMGDKAIAKKMNVPWDKKKVGDIVLFDFNGNGTSDHIGIVIGISGSKIKTVEGNTGAGSNTNGGQVQIRERTKGQVNYFVRPKYDDKVTAEMVIKTAKREVGTVESPRNSNKVKYNRWFYGSNVSAYWCCTFVCWVFAHVKEAIKPIDKPTTKYSGKIPKPTIKDGTKGKKVKQLQAFLNWYGGFGLKEDGEFGSASENALMVFQMTEGLAVDGEYGSKSYSKALTYYGKPTTKSGGDTPSEGVTTEGVVEESPSGTVDEKPASVSNAKLIGDMALELSWATNTPKSQWDYTYSKNKKWTKWSQLGKAKPKKKCMEAADKYMPNHWSKGSARFGYGGRVFACCDKFVSLVIRAAGVNRSMPSTLEEFFKGKGFGKFEKVKTGGKASKMKHGDVIVFKRKSGGGHTLIVAEHGGKKLGCQAGLNHYFPRRKKLTNYDLSDYKKFDVWRAK